MPEPAQPPPPSAAKYQALSALAASTAATEATAALAQGAAALAATVVKWQIRSAILAERGVAQMLAEQNIPVRPLARLNPAAFTTPPRVVQQMAEPIEEEWQIERMVASITQEAARAAQEAAIAVQDEDLGYVRMLNLPSCSRCVILAGKTYVWEADFDRHTGCDCTAIPVAEHDTSFVPDPEGLARQGLVTGLSKADLEAINHGADMSRVVNIRRRAAGLSVAGEVLARAGRLTPAGARRAANGDKDRYLDLLDQNGYFVNPANTRSPRPQAPTRSASGHGGGTPPPPPAPPGGTGDGAGGTWSESERASRQAALGIETHGEKLERAEILAAEAMQRLGHELEWIPTSTERATNDFIWLNNGGIEVELKSPGSQASLSEPLSPKHLIRPIVKEFKKPHPVAGNFLIDLLDRPLTPEMRTTLANFNRSHADYAIQRLWVMSGGRLEELPLN